MSESLIARPLTLMQRVTLLAIAQGGLCAMRRYGRGHMYTSIHAPRCGDISAYIRPLRRRGFVSFTARGVPELTVAGAFELFFDAERLIP